jgi:acylphosphatase
MTTPIGRLDATARGRVQGVGFRAFVLDTARGLGLNGWVRNEPDGAVRCVAEGPLDRLERLEAALRLGPPAARVDRLDVHRSEPAGLDVGFHVRSGWLAGD